jgi:hypothetical protein
MAMAVHNNARNATTGFPPNTLLLGWEPLLSPDQITHTSNQKAEDYVTKFQKNCLMAILALNKAASAHAPLSSKYSQGQRVWLEGKNLPISHGTVKLSPKRYGPFSITKLISPVASQLDLPASWNIHPVFHNNLLTPYIETNAHGPNFTRPPPDLINGEAEYEVEAIRNHRHFGKNKRLQYLLKWKGYFAALIRVDITPSSSTTPPLHFTLSSSEPSRVLHALSNARPSSSPPTTRFTQTTLLPSAPPQTTTPPAPTAMSPGQCHMSYLTATPSGRLGASSSNPSIIILSTTSSLPKTADVASSNSSMPHKPYFAPCPRAPPTRLGLEPGNWLPSNRGVRTIVSTLSFTSLPSTPLSLPFLYYAYLLERCMTHSPMVTHRDSKVNIFHMII